MMRRRLILGFVATLALGVSAFGCGGSEPVPVAATPPPPKARNAAEIATSIVHGEVGAMIYVERLRGHPLAGKIASLDVIRPYLEGTGLEPERDLSRAFVAAPAANRGDETIVVAEHRLTNDQLRTALEGLIAQGKVDGEWMEGTSVPLARVRAKGQTRAVGLIEPNFVVVMPAAHAMEATRFVGTGGFPDPTGSEVAVASAREPARTLRGPHVPAWPPTIASASAKITLAEDGGMDVAVDAPSTDPQQAAADAEAVARAVDNATSVKIAFVRVRVFKQIPFYAEGSEVKSKLHLTPGELDTLFSAAAAMIPR